MRSRRGSVLVALSFALAVAASAFGLFAPTGRHEEAGAQGLAEDGSPGVPEPPLVGDGSTTLLIEIRSGNEDRIVLVFLVVPVALGLVPLALVRTRLDLATGTVAASASSHSSSWPPSRSALLRPERCSDGRRGGRQDRRCGERGSDEFALIVGGCRACSRTGPAPEARRRRDTPTRWAKQDAPSPSMLGA